MLTLRLPSDIESRLEFLSKSTGRTKSYYAREAIVKHLEDMEDIYLAEKRMEDIRAGRTKTHSLSEVEESLGLAD